jgi:hypothetical protein
VGVSFDQRGHFGGHEGVAVGDNIPLAQKIDPSTLPEAMPRQWECVGGINYLCNVLLCMFFLWLTMAVPGRLWGPFGPKMTFWGFFRGATFTAE